jgi:hypothetical protein
MQLPSILDIAFEWHHLKYNILNMQYYFCNYLKIFVKESHVLVIIFMVLILDLDTRPLDLDHGP